MSASADKVKGILSQIEGENENIVSDRKTLNEVVDIFLKDTQPQQDRDLQNGVFDMEELQHWKEQMNVTYQTSCEHEIICHRRHFCRLIIFIKRLIRKACRFLLQPVVEEQNTFNANTTAAVNALYNNEVVTSQFIAGTDSVSSCNEKILEQENKILIQGEKIADLENRNLELEEIITNLEQKSLKQAEEQHARMEARIEARMEAAILRQTDILNEVQDKYAKMIHQIEQRHTEDEMLLFRNTRLRFALPHTEHSGMDKVSMKHTDQVNADVYAEMDYFDFENYFRGSRAQIKEAESIYIPYFLEKELVLDLGCGRGEFLELLKENSIQGIGIDAYEEFVAYCQAKGLDVRQDDAIRFLENTEKESVDGIFAAQLIEHLSTGQLLALCHLAYEKLKQGGCLILETPNPMCLSIYMNAFYMDPSHQKPVHAKTMEYLLKREGFQKVDLLFTEESKSDYRLPLLSCETSSNLSEFNDGMNLLSDLLFGSQNYAVIAVK